MFFPYIKENLTLANKINFIVLFFILYFVMTIIENLDWFDYVFTYNQYDSFSFINTIVILILCISTVLLLLKRKKTGWILAICLLIYSLLTKGNSLYQYLYIKITEPGRSLDKTTDLFDFFDSYILLINPYSHTIVLLFYVLMIWTLKNKDLLIEFGLTNTTASKIILITTFLLTVILFYPYFYY